MVSSATISAADEKKVWHREELAATDGRNATESHSAERIREIGGWEL
jgi:hypothetical protein